MLSSLGKSLTNLYNTTTTSISNTLSPQSILASYLSKSLAEFFDNVDPNQVETSLTSSSDNVAPHVSLKNVHFKPRLVDGNTAARKAELSQRQYLLLTGSIEAIEFSWKWGSGGKTDATGVNAYITDVQLKVSGVRILLSEPKSTDDEDRIAHLLSQIKIVMGDEEESKSPASEVSGKDNVSITQASLSSPEEEKQMVAGSADWKTRYMQQILDHLTLSISDIEIRVNLPSSVNDAKDPTKSSSIIVEGSEIELLSLDHAGSLNDSQDNDENAATASTPHLRQRIRVGSISSHILFVSSSTNDESDSGPDSHNNKIPLLDEFGYRAIVARISGRRFLDGIMNGLVVTGEMILESISSSTTETLLPSHHQAANMVRLHIGKEQVDALLKLQDMLGIVETGDNASTQPSTAANKEDAIGTYRDCSASINSSQSSFFNLPIQYIAIVLEENGTEIKLDGCTVYYRTDGSEFIVDCGSGGVLINDEYVTTKGLGHVTIDLVKSCIVVDPCNTNEIGAQKSTTTNTPTTTRISTPDDPYQKDAFYDTSTDVAKESKQVEPSSSVNAVVHISLAVTLIERVWQGVRPVKELMQASTMETATSSSMVSSDQGGNRWKLSINGKACCHLYTENRRWLEASISSLVVAGASKHDDVDGTGQVCLGAMENKLDGNGLPVDIEWDSIEVQYLSSSDASIAIPAAKTSSNGTDLVVNGTVKATSNSIDTLNDIQSMVESFIAIFDEDGIKTGISKESSQESSNNVLPVRLILPKVHLSLTGGPLAGEVFVDRMEGNFSGWKCSRLMARGFVGNGAFFEATDIKGSVEASRFNAEFSLLEFCLPSIGRLTQVVDSVTLVVENDLCIVNFSDVIGSISSENASEAAYTEPEQPILDLPFDLKLTVSHLRLDQAINDGTSTIQAGYLSVDALRNFGSEQHGSISQGMSVNVEAQCKRLDVELVDAMRGSFNQVSTILSIEDQKLHKTTNPINWILPGIGSVPSASVKIDSVSHLDIYGVASLSQPLSGMSAVMENGVLSVDLPPTSVAVFDGNKIESTSKDCPTIDASSPTIVDITLDLKVSTPFIELSDGQSYVRCSELEAFVVRSADPQSPALSTGVECKRLDLMLNKFMHCSLQGVTGSMVGRKLCGDIDSNCVSLSGLGDVSQASMLVESITKLSIAEVGHLARPLSSISVAMENGVGKIVLDQINWNHVESRPSKLSQGRSYPLPCPFTVQFHQLHVTRDSSSNLPSSYVSCGSTEVHVLPGAAGLWQVNIPRCTQVQYMGMVKVPVVSVTACVNPSQLYTINDLAVLARKVELTADFRSESWSDSLEETIIYSLPDVHIHEMDLVLNFQGGLLISVDDAVLRIAAFKGGTKSDSISLTQHYVNKVKSRIPFLLTKANICGTNVGDSVGQTVAAVAMNSTVVGSVVGVVGRDAVGATITKGKSMRGAGEAEGYKFGDLSRGIAGSARSITSNPSAAASSAAEYTSENRVKLSGAGGAGIGMMAGMALAGPIGLVAGSIIGSQAARSAVAGAFGDPKQKQDDAEKSNANGPLRRQDRHIAPSQQHQPVPPQDAFRAFHTTNANTETNSTHMGAHQNLGHHYLHQQQQQQQIYTQPAPATASTGSAARHSYQAGTTQRGNNFASQQAASATISSHGRHQQNQLQQQQQQQQKQQQNPAGGGYQFGSITKGIIARGKQRRGQDSNSGYKFGDFSRGLFGK